MSKILVPAAPTLEPAARQSGEERASASKTQSPLDAAFLGRIYRSMAWFGVVLVVLAALGTKNGAIVASLTSGLVLAALLLRAQEIGVRALMRPSEQLGGFDARLILILLLPLKFVLIVGVLAALNYFGLILPAILALGFFAGQLVIVAKVVGWMLTRAAKN
ncbi:MAG: hypothetical protein KY445_13230 [Armatimonadetes bacterium]|nr:hypothetical protein [Armatimonadota bacterium]